MTAPASSALPGLRCGVPDGHDGHIILRPGDRRYWCNGNPPLARPVVTITDAMLAQWRESAEADLAGERSWQCHPAAILAVLDALADARRTREQS